jgi:hypothetical protein
MGNFAIQKTISVNGVSPGQFVEKFEDQMGVFFKSVDITRQFDDALEFTGKLNAHSEFAVNGRVKLRMRENRVDIRVEGTVGLSGTGILIVVLCFLGLVVLGIGVAIYYECVSEKVVNATFTQLLGSLEFDLS